MGCGLARGRCQHRASTRRDDKIQIRRVARVADTMRVGQQQHIGSPCSINQIAKPAKPKIVDQQKILFGVLLIYVHEK